MCATIKAALLSSTIETVLQADSTRYRFERISSASGTRGSCPNVPPTFSSDGRSGRSIGASRLSNFSKRDARRSFDSFNVPKFALNIRNGSNVFSERLFWVHKICD